ncbi:DUF805 domain-containing protein [Rhodoglobus sp. NPDC076762]
MSTSSGTHYGQYSTPAVTGAGDDLSQPLYGASFGAAVSRFWKKSTTFSGRASRSEFWWAQAMLALMIFAFFSIVVALSIVFSGGEGASSSPSLVLVVVYLVAAVAFLATVLPSWAIYWRRFHDANFTGALYLASLIPVIGGIVVLIIALLPSNPRGARFDEQAGTVGLTPYVPQQQ